MSSNTPIFDFSDHFDAKITIGDKELPFKVQRLSRAEMETFEKKWGEFLELSRGVTTLSAEEQTIREASGKVFAEDSIRSYMTLAPGLVRDKGTDVIDGLGFIGVFHARRDVLSAVLLQIYAKNMLSDIVRKNSESPQGSASGSEALIPTRGGDAQGSIATSAESSSIAPLAAATDKSDEPEGSQSSSGAPTSSEPKIH